MAGVAVAEPIIPLDEAPDLLLIEDDEVFSAVLARALERRGYCVRIAHDAQGARELARQFAPQRAVLDLNLRGENGLLLIRPLLEAAPDCRVVVLTGYASIATAVDAMRRGAWNYLPKPFDIEALAQSFEAPGEDVAPPPAAPVSLRRQGWEHMQRVLAECGGNVSQAARVLGVDRRTLQRKLAKRPVKERPE